MDSLRKDKSTAMNINEKRFFLDKNEGQWYIVEKDYKYDWAEWCDIYDLIHPGEEKKIPEYARKIKHPSWIMFSNPEVPAWAIDET